MERGQKSFARVGCGLAGRDCSFHRRLNVARGADALRVASAAVGDFTGLFFAELIK